MYIYIQHLFKNLALPDICRLSYSLQGRDCTTGADLSLANNCIVLSPAKNTTSCHSNHSAALQQAIFSRVTCSHSMLLHLREETVDTSGFQPGLVLVVHDYISPSLFQPRSIYWLPQLCLVFSTGLKIAVQGNPRSALTSIRYAGHLFLQPQAPPDWPSSLPR